MPCSALRRRPGRPRPGVGVVCESGEEHEAAASEGRLVKCRGTGSVHQNDFGRSSLSGDDIDLSLLVLGTLLCPLPIVDAANASPGRIYKSKYVVSLARWLISSTQPK